MKTTEHLLSPFRQAFEQVVPESGDFGDTALDFEDPFRAIFEDLPDPFLIMDPDGNIFYANSAWRAKRNLSLEEVVGSNISDSLTGQILEESLGRRAMLRTLTPQDRVASHDFFDASGIWFHAVYKGWFNDSQQLVAISAVARDRSDVHRYQTRLEDANRLLQESNRDLQDFAHIASHDLQEPLRKISAFTGRLEEKYSDVLDERGVDYLRRVSGASKRMQSLINDLLTFSRIQTHASDPERCDLSEVVTGVLSDLEVAVSESDAAVSIGQLPTIEADPSQMRQLFQNLIANALKFRRPDVPPVITVDAEHGSDGDEWVIRVADNGIGFEAQHKEKIFSMFQRLHARSEYEGSGVGLSVCRRIVERHGGTLTAEGTSGTGSVFTITI